MKRIYSYAAIAAAILAMSACSGTQKSADAAEVAEVTDFTPVQETYAGVLPAADADGIQYTVVLDYDSDGGEEARGGGSGGRVFAWDGRGWILAARSEAGESEDCMPMERAKS